SWDNASRLGNGYSLSAISVPRESAGDLPSPSRVIPHSGKSPPTQRLRENRVKFSAPIADMTLPLQELRDADRHAGTSGQLHPRGPASMFSFFRRTFRQWARGGTQSGSPNGPAPRLQC